MKSKTKMYLLVFTMLGLIFSACNKSEDLVTENAKAGGLVTPLANYAYKLGATPQFTVTLTVPKGPGISKIEVYNQFFRNSDTKVSNKALMKTIDVSSENVTADAIKDFTLTFEDMVKDLQIDGQPIPPDPSLITPGDNWIFTYVSTLADGRVVTNARNTNVAAANRWAGAYLLSSAVLREGDPVLSGHFSNLPWTLLTAGSKSVIYGAIHPWADGSSLIGGIGPWLLTIDDSGGPDNPMPVVVSDAANAAVVNNPADFNRYEPSTKTFFISVYWGTGPTNRAAKDTLVYNGS